MKNIKKNIDFKETYDVKIIESEISKKEKEVKLFAKNLKVKQKKVLSRKDGEFLLNAGLKVGFLRGRLTEIQKISAECEQPDYCG